MGKGIGKVAVLFVPQFYDIYVVISELALFFHEVTWNTCSTKCYCWTSSVCYCQVNNILMSTLQHFRLDMQCLQHNADSSGLNCSLL